MAAIEYLRKKNRMTKRCQIGCDYCPLGIAQNGTGSGCVALERKMPEKAVEIVEKWAKEHPQKTYVQDFFEKFPDAPKNPSGNPKFCRDYAYGKHKCDPSECSDCWNEPMDE